MFGYIKPVKSELRVRQFEHYRAVYCGLCNALRKKFGLLSRFLINYDFTFLALVLSDDECGYEKCCCVAHPFCKRTACVGGDTFDAAACASVILAYWQLCDQIEDKPFFKALGARAVRSFASHAYKKASGLLCEFDREVRLQLSKLHELEAKKTASLDAPADTFAKITASLADFSKNPRVVRELFYHVGRIIYLTDALCDVKEDLESGNYNPIITRYEIKTAPLETDIKETVEASIYQSVSAANAALALLSHPQSELIENILNLGIPAAVMRAGMGKKPEKEKLNERSL